MKNLKNLGKALNKAEQKTINGGKRPLDPIEAEVWRCYYANGQYAGCAYLPHYCSQWPGSHAVGAATCL